VATWAEALQRDGGLSVLATLRLLVDLWRTSLAAELEYRVNFLIACLTSVGNLAGSVFGLYLFYQGDYQFEGWSLVDSLAVLGTFTALTGFNLMFLTPNLSELVDHVQSGTLDFVLLKPVDSQLWVSARKVSPWGLPDLLAGIGLLAWVAWERGAGLSGLALAIVPILAAAVLLYGLWFLVASTSIWFVKIYNATEVLRGVLEAGRYPMAAYPATWRFVFTFIVPVAFLTTVPAEVVLGRGEGTALLAALVLAAVAFVVSRWFWRFALKSYTSASS
jgi:ABC-2 type transport system permease protein